MNEEIVRALLEAKRLKGDRILSDVRLTEACLKDLLPKHVGERRLLLNLVEEGVAHKARNGGLDSDSALNIEARHIARTYFVDEGTARRALLVWRHVARADAAAVASGRVDAGLLRDLAACSAVPPQPPPEPPPQPPREPPPSPRTPSPTTDARDARDAGGGSCGSARASRPATIIRDVSCGFCGYQPFQTNGSLGGGTKTRKMHLCPHCSTILCSECLLEDVKFGFIKRKRCLRCGRDIG